MIRELKWQFEKTKTRLVCECGILSLNPPKSFLFIFINVHVAVNLHAFMYCFRPEKLNGIYFSPCREYQTKTNHVVIIVTSYSCADCISIAETFIVRTCF